MVKTVIAGLFFILIMVNPGIAQKIIFEEGTWTEALAKAKQENKLLFVDACTSWCGPCRRMEREVFTRPEVEQYYKARFVCYQQDMEKGAGPEMKKRYNVEAYPTFLFLDGEGKLIFKLVGYHRSWDFLRETEKVKVYARYGGWEAVKLACDSGVIGTDFWKAYSELAAPEEMPVILKQWMPAMSDEELFSMQTVSLFDKVDYNYDLFLRIVKGLVKGYNPIFQIMHIPVFQKKMAEYLGESIREGNKTRFRELMELKEVLEQIPDIVHRKDIYVCWNQESLLKASPEFLHLCYDQQNRTNEIEFKKLLPVYMERLMASEPLDSLSKELLHKEKEVIVDTQNFAKSAAELMGRYDLMVNSIINWADYYRCISPWNKAIREQCTAWVDYACRVNPYHPEIPLKAALLWMHLGDKKKAVVCLEKAIEAQKKIRIPDKKGMENLQNRLNEIRSSKGSGLY